MTWHLKDRELEKKLIAIDPDFVKTLTDTVEENITNNWFDKDSITDVELKYNGVYLVTVCFLTHELEEIPEYNPKDWNDFPKITPPHNVTMQIEYDRDFPYGAVRVRVIGIYCELRKCWFMFDPNSDEGLTHLGCPIRRIGIYENLRFRPLED